MDTSIVKADIFFFVTTIAVVVLTLILSIIMIYLISILRYVKHISQIAKDQAEVISDDIDDLRGTIKTKGASLASIFDFLGSMTRKKVDKKTKRK
jgi:MFS superfamily sulfate permease-like transporter